MNWYKKANGDNPILVDWSEGTAPSPKEVTNILGGVLQTTGCSPQDINNGNCDSFAEQVKNSIPGTYIYETDFSFDLPTHLFLKIGNLYYDAESLGGVTDWKMLNIYNGQL